MTHPNTIDLEAFACGEPSSRVTSHLGTCEPCRAFVDRARKLAEGAPRTDLKPIVANARVRERARRRVLAGGTVVFAVAAAALVWVGASKAPSLTPTAPGAVAALSALSPEPDTTFKGTLQVTVIREREKAQERFTGSVRVQPGDRLRVEVALDRSRAILGAVLDDDNGYLELMAEGVRPAGAHLSERSARIDSDPKRGTIVVGTPEAVRRARATHRFDDLATVRVEWEKAP